MHRAALMAMLEAIVLAANLPPAAGMSVTPEEMDACRQWSAAHLHARGARAPFSFLLGDRESADLLTRWPLEHAAEALDERRVRHTLNWADPQTGLAVRCVAVEYLDYPVVEWTVYLRNDGSAPSPLIESLRALDIEMQSAGADEFLLHHSVGSPCTAEDYRPLETVLEPGSRLRIAAAGGRSTSSDLSYFNLELAPEQGLIVAIGWPGQWASEWTRDGARGLRVAAGQESCHLSLLPGEEIRSPLIALQFWAGDWLRAQNVWRRWFIAHSIPRPGGALPPTQWCGSNEAETQMMVFATEEKIKRFVDAYVAHGWQPDFWWMDAGWYPCDGDWTCTGTWEADPARFPNGLRPVMDYLHAHGMRSILWFEPERVRPGTWLATEHPQWLLTRPGDPEDPDAWERVVGHDALLDLGNPEARDWVVEHVSRLIAQWGIDIYRQDLNTDPLPYWTAHDTPDRQGMTENRYVTGLLAYWDELLRRHSGLLYDNCAGGGRRNDLETMRRGVPYTKSDYADDPAGVQGETYGISLWLPYFAATWGRSDDPYLCRSRMAQVFGVSFQSDIPGHLARLPQRLAEWRQVVPHYWGDFWPLTPYSLESTAWIAWQFDGPEEGRGVVQAFRRADCAEEIIRLKLRGLDPAATYQVKDLDGAQPRDLTGSVLMVEGLDVSVPGKPGAAIVIYERL